MKKLFGLILASALVFGNSASAVGLTVGGSLGYGSTTVMQRYVNSVTNLNGTDAISGLSFGGELSYKLNSMAGVGVSYLSLGGSLPVTSLSTNQNQKMEFFLANFEIRPFGSLLGLYGGVLAGLGVYSGHMTIDATGANTDPAQSFFAAGARVGYDFGLLLGLTMGPEVRAIFVPADSTKHTFAGLFNVKFSF